MGRKVLSGLFVAMALTGLMMPWSTVRVSAMHAIPAAAQRYVPGFYPCAIVTCVAAHSVVRRIVPTYTGNLFQLKRTSDSTTQNIGQTASGQVNMATISTFCGAANANGCGFHIIYDQSGNSNDMTTCGGCTDTPYETDSVRALPRVHSTGTASQYLDAASLTNVPTGNVNKSVMAVMNDTIATNCCTDYSLEHGTAEADTVGSSFGPIIEWQNNSNNDWGFFGTDVETTQLLVPYTNDEPSSSSTEAHTHAIGSWGDVVLFSTYATSGTITLADWMGGYSVATGNSVTQVTPTTEHIRLGAGGDASVITAIWYEGIIASATWTQGQREALALNVSEYYGFPLVPSCVNAVRPPDVIETLGNANVSAAWGLRRMNPHNQGAVAQLQRASDSHFQTFGTVGCDFDSASASTFCNATSCVVTALFNQVIPASLGLVNFTTGARDNWKATATSNQPSYTASCLGSLPCMTFASSSQMIAADNIGSPPTWTAPYTLFAVIKNTESAGGGGFIWGDNAVIPYLGGDYNASAGNIQCAAGGYPDTGASAAHANSTWYATACQIPDTTHATLFVNGTQTGPTASTINSSTSRLLFGQSSFFTGGMAELAVVVGSVSTTNVANITTNQKSYWGF